MAQDSKRGHGINTRLAHGGHNPRDFHGFVNPPVVHASGSECECSQAGCEAK